MDIFIPAFIKRTKVKKKKNKTKCTITGINIEIDPARKKVDCLQYYFV